MNSTRNRTKYKLMKIQPVWSYNLEILKRWNCTKSFTAKFQARQCVIFRLNNEHIMYNIMPWENAGTLKSFAVFHGYQQIMSEISTLDVLSSQSLSLGKHWHCLAMIENLSNTRLAYIDGVVTHRGNEKRNWKAPTQNIVISSRMSIYGFIECFETSASKQPAKPYTPANLRRIGLSYSENLHFKERGNMSSSMRFKITSSHLQYIRRLHAICRRR